jgi:hypothetical protein
MRTGEHVEPKALHLTCKIPTVHFSVVLHESMQQVARVAGKEEGKVTTLGLSNLVSLQRFESKIPTMIQ